MRETHSLLARSRAYHLLSRLYFEELSPALLPAVEATPELAEALPVPFSADEAAADYQHLFGFNVFPFASVFLDPEGMLDGPVTDYVRRQFQRAGCPTPLTGEAPDHLGQELTLLAFLARAEAGAWIDGLPTEARRIRRLERRFMDEHLLGWLIPFTQAVRDEGFPFFTVLAELTLDLALDHRSALDDGGRPPLKRFTLPEPPPLLDDPGTGLKDIAAYLTTPPWAGLFLSRDAITRLGRYAGVPRGFGDRTRMLANLFRAAAEYDRLDAVLEHLTALTGAWRAHYVSLCSRNTPGLSEIIDEWTGRLATTERLLTRIHEAVRQPNGQNS